MKNKKVKILIICIGIMMAGICYIFGCGLPDSESGTVFQLAEISEADREGQAAGENTDQQPDSQEDVTSGSDVAKTEVTTEAPGIFVHVCGEVVKPGVYEMMQGSRVFEAVEQAGGFTDKAAAEYLNLAQTLTDGMKITVPDEEAAKTLTKPEAVQNPGVDDQNQLAAEEKVNINTAEKEQLMTLRGVGEARAADIIAYREQNGPFKKIEDIMGVSGIKEAAFQKIKENITI